MNGLRTVLRRAAYSIILLLTLPVAALGQTELLAVRHWSAPDHTRVVIDASAAPKYVIEKSNGKIGIEFSHAFLSPHVPAEVIIQKTGLERIAVHTRPAGIVRFEVWLSPEATAKVFRLRKFEEKPDRVVIDIALPDMEKKESETRQLVKNTKKDKIIVIDPGHGGDDPGAVGKGGTYEKNVVLDIARKLRDELNGLEGFRAFLTREGDYYLPFRKRVNIAREYGADLFVSIHADAAKNRNAKGSSVYCLSAGGASSAAAKVLARKENLADIIGGSGDEDVAPGESAPIILTMCQTSTINQAKHYGNKFLRHLDDVGDVKIATVQEAPFAVLKLPDIPSLLVETAFISNPEEEKLLRSDIFKGELARALTLAAGQCLGASDASLLALRTKTLDNGAAGEGIFYRVRKGDTVSGIAARYGMTTEEVLRLNRMKPGASLYVNRLLRVAGVDAAEKDEDQESRPVSQSGEKRPVVRPALYTVKKGDTLAAIAAEQGISLGTLLEINHRKLDDPLYAGTKIRLQEKKQRTVTAAREPTGKTLQTVRSALYTVKKGDTLATIAAEQGISLGTLLEINHRKLDDPLYAGTKIRLQEVQAGRDGEPGRHARVAKRGKSIRSGKHHETYRVRKGDTLKTIAQRHGTTISTLLSMNGLKRSDHLAVDQKLKLPAASSL